MEDNISSRPTTTSAEVVGQNQDLLTEILLRVPAKPLLKFKCVSKQWLSLISDPKFCLSHTLHLFTHNPTPSALLLNNDYNSTPRGFEIVPLKDDHLKVPHLYYLNVPKIKIFQCCNGLLLCGKELMTDKFVRFKRKITEMWFKFNYKSHEYDDGMELNCFICNPTTKQFKIISYPLHRRKTRGFHCQFYLAFDPLKSPHYKILSVFRLSGHYEIDIYFSETDSWSFERHSIQLPPKVIIHQWVFFNGAIHWLSDGESSHYFEVDSESMKTFPMPPMSVTSVINYFGESKGNLHIGVAIDHLHLEFDVWELELDYSGWFLKYHVNLQQMTTELPELIWDRGPYETPFTVLGIIRAEKEEDSTLVVYVDSKAISYSIFNGTSKELCDLESQINPANLPLFRPLDYKWNEAHRYIETLICV